MAFNLPTFTPGTVTYKDLDLSFKPNPMTGDLRTKTDVDAVKQSIKNLLYTKLGEIPFKPDLGSGLNDLLFEPLDQITRIELTSNIANTINSYEPRVKILELTINENQRNSSITIFLRLQILNILEPQTVQVLLYRVR